MNLLRHLRDDEAGIDGVHPYSLRPQPLGKHPGKAPHRPFRRAVYHRAGSPQRRQGGDVDDGARPILRAFRIGVLYGHEGGYKIGVHGLPVILHGELFLQAAVGPPGARAVDQDIHPPEFLHRVCHHVFTAFLIGQIGGKALAYSIVFHDFPLYLL